MDKAMTGWGRVPDQVRDDRGRGNDGCVYSRNGRRESKVSFIIFDHS